MINEPSEKDFKDIPKLYGTENIPFEEKYVYLHFFLGKNDWWVLEYDPEEKLFFGIAKIFDIEAGYFSLEDLKNTKAFGLFDIERDTYFKIKKVKEIDELKNWLKIYY